MTRSAYTATGGGIDLVTPPAQLPPGACLYAVNYDCPVTGGYRRIEGYTKMGPEVPGEGPLLGVASFADDEYAIRKNVGADAATLYRLAGSTWETVGAVHNGRHEFVEGNVTGTEKGRALYGVGGGHPFQLYAAVADPVAYDNARLVVSALRGNLPEGVAYTPSDKGIWIGDNQGRDITGIEVFDKTDASLTAATSKTGNGDDPTIVDIDLGSLDHNNIGYIRFTVGSEPQVTLAIPELADPLLTLDGVSDGARYIALFKNHLFLGFEDGRIVHSGIGRPNNWSASLGGAGEIGVGQTISGLLEGRGGTLHVLCRDSIKTLYGTSAQDWELRVTIPNSGARPYSAQNMVQPYFIAERGIASLAATDEYGDFRPMQPGHKVEPIFLEDNLFTRVKASAISKQRAQYRVWFDNGTGVYMSPTGITTVRFPAQVEVAHSGERDDGNESLLFGDDAGNVYRLDNGATSFDGAPIEAFLTLAYNTLQSPSVRKRFRRVFWDVRSGSDANISILTDFDYGRMETATPRREFIQFLLGGGLWDVANWDQFSWSTPSLGQEPMNVSGTGTAINFAIYSSSDSEPHEILGYDLHFEQRRRRRG